MKMRSPGPALLGLVVVAALGGGACARLQSKQAFRDGNKQYKDENYKKAIEYYERATKLDPNMGEAWFYLGSSHQALYRPAKDTPDNKAHLEKAIEGFNKSLEVNQRTDENLKKVWTNTLGALTGIYSEDPYRNYDKALGYAQKLVQDAPDDPKNLYAVANLYEKFEKVEKAEETYRRVYQQNPNDTRACGALAAFFNKPLWNGRSKFEEAIDILERCAALNPNDPAGWQKVATFYWDKTYRDPDLSPDQKNQYADKGLAAVDKALALKADYFEGVTFKGLLLREKAKVASDPRLRQQFLDQAIVLQKQALEIRKQQQEEAAAAAAAGSPAPGS